MAPRASVVLLTANRRPLLERCLASLEAQTRRPDEVVVVDNHSTDDTRAFLTAYAGPLSLVVKEGPEKGSYSAARQLAVDSATGDCIAFTDDDCEADRFWLERLLARLETWGAVGGTVLQATEAATPDWYAPEMAWAVGLLPPAWFGREGGRTVLPTTANLAFRRDTMQRHPFQRVAVDATGAAAWNLEFSREDSEWWRRLRLAGEPIGIEPRAIVWHHIPPARYDWETILERMRADGRALWRREGTDWQVDAACADILAAPERAVRQALGMERTPQQAWANQQLWAARQAAFLRLGVDDTRRPLDPQRRTRGFLKSAVRQPLGLMKSALRHTLVAAHEGLRPRLPIPTVKNPPRRLMVVLHPFLGDFVMALPMLRQLAEAMPDAQRTLLVGGGVATLAERQLPQWKVRAVPGAAVGKGPAVYAALGAFLRPFAPDLIIWTYLHRLQPLAFFTHLHAPIVGWAHDNGTYQRLWGELIDAPVEKRWDQLEVAALLNLLGPLGITPRFEHPTVVPDAAATARVDEVLRRLGVSGGEPTALLQVEDETRARNWAVSNWAVVARRLVAAGYRVLLDGARASRGAAERLRREVPEALALHGAFDTAELASLLERVDVFAGADSGPAHLAAAVSCPSVVLFGPSPARRWGGLPQIAGGRADSRLILRPATDDWTHEEEDRLGPRGPLALLDPHVVADAVLRHARKAPPE